MNNSQWFLFNDFKVRKVPEIHALQFPRWKIPCLLQYSRTKNVDLVIPNCEPDFEAKPLNLNANKLEYPLKIQEINSSFCCAIDCEFVSLREEVADFTSEGKKTVISPAYLSLARVSLVRASGPLKGTVCLDDYIEPREEIVNYLTQFSGIRPEDLNKETSTHNLITLKTAYRKLRYMIDAKVLFIGHGLQQDFRILNMIVPNDQIFDTVDKYLHSSNQRKLSLKFLAWAVLGKFIQLTNHDSVEDADAALQLYNCYLEKKDSFDSFLLNIYKIGKINGYKPPKKIKNQ